MNRLIRAISDDGSVVCYAMDSTQMIAKAEHIHHTSAAVTAALGRTLTATSLLGFQMLKEDQTATVHIKGDGPVGAIVAVTDAKGNVRGYVGQPIVELPLNDHGKLDVAGVVGTTGTLQVLRDMGGESKEPFVGSVPLVSGEIAEDFTSYYAHSEQIPTAMALGVLVNPDLTVSNAGGFLAQLLPGASEESIQTLEDNLQNIPPITQLYAEGKTPEDVVGLVLKGMNPKVLEVANPEYRCNCTRERVEGALISIGRDELLSLAEEQDVTEVDCHFCPKIYRFNPQELKGLAEQA